MKIRTGWLCQPGRAAILSIAFGMAAYAIGAVLLSPWLGAVLMAMVVGGWFYAALHQMESIHHDLRQQLADRGDALTSAQAPIIPIHPLLDAINAIIASITDSVLVTDRSGAIMLANPAAQHLIDCSPASVIGTTLEMWLAGVTHRDECEPIVQAIQTLTPLISAKMEWSGNRTVTFSLAPIALAGHQRPIGMVIVGHDVTREAELDRLKSRFISMISHELRTPLIAILSQIEVWMLGGQAALSDRQRSAVQRITVNARHLLRLITDLLDHAQIEAGQVLSLQPVPFAPVALLEDLRATLLPAAEAKGLSLVLVFDPDLPMCVIGDPERLKQILFNLVGNAIKFTERGTVAVQIACRDSDHWLLQVTDTGHGIAPEDQAHLFEPFYRAGSQAGTGLGLSIVQHLVMLMQGRIEVGSVLDQGATFTVTLPLIVPTP